MSLDKSEAVAVVKGGLGQLSSEGLNRVIKSRSSTMLLNGSVVRPEEGG